MAKRMCLGHALKQLTHSTVLSPKPKETKVVGVQVIGVKINGRGAKGFWLAK